VQAQRRAASAGLAQAKVAVENAEVEVERARKLAKANALPKADLDRAEAGLKTARAAVRAAAAQVRVAATGIALVDHTLGYVEVVAPRTGVVTSVSTTVGAMASPQAPLATIQDQSELLLHMKVPAEGLVALERNPKVEFVIAALPGRRFHGTVKVVTPTLDPQSRRAHVEVTVDPSQKGLLPHMFAEVDLVTSKRAALLSAPLGAVLTTVKGSQVFVARAGKAIALNVDLKHADAEFVPVPDARAGDKVIVSGQGDLVAGGAIRVVDKAKPASVKKSAEAEKGATR